MTHDRLFLITADVFPSPRNAGEGDEKIPLIKIITHLSLSNADTHTTGVSETREKERRENTRERECRKLPELCERVRERNAGTKAHCE
jgi:hypothetical protein